MLEVRVVEQHLIPYVEQLVLSNVPGKRWVFDPYAHSLPDGPGETMYPPTHNGEIFQLDMMI